MKHNTILFTVLLGLNLLSITACSSISEQLGMNRRAPDEFAVVTRAPLQIPSNLDQLTSLPAPQLGAARPQETDTRILAKQAIGITPSSENSLGNSLASTTSAAEAGLLSRVGKADQNIRATIDQEAVNTTEQRPVAKRLLNIGDDKPAARILDPKAEKERIKTKSTIETPSKLD